MQLLNGSYMKHVLRLREAVASCVDMLLTRASDPLRDPQHAYALECLGIGPSERLLPRNIPLWEALRVPPQETTITLVLRSKGEVSCAEDYHNNDTAKRLVDEVLGNHYSFFNEWGRDYCKDMIEPAAALKDFYKNFPHAITSRLSTTSELGYVNPAIGGGVGPRGPPPPGP
mmetsp:Transcript_58929/g.156053  ORF Transcript_58929/g.156053 Transcript_58929/m.156053 type:complete len:172 (-) Transcript_58929:53-568(-)